MFGKSPKNGPVGCSPTVIRRGHLHSTESFVILKKVEEVGEREGRCSNLNLNTKESVHLSEFPMNSLNSFLMGPVSWMISEFSI